MAGHPTECAFDGLASWQNNEGGFGAFDDVEREIDEGCFVHESASVMGAVGEEPFDPGSLAVESIENGPGSGTVGDVGWREMHEQETAVGVDGEVTLPPGRPPGSIKAAFGFRRRRFDGLAVDHGGGRFDGAAHQCPIDHQGDIVDGAKHQPPCQASKPPIHGLPGREVDRQHRPGAS